MNQTISPALILSILGAYFLLLIGISLLTGRRATNSDFFLAGKKSPWPLVAFGMIGASLSGVTFISVPGAVGGDGVNMGFAYMQMVLGYMVGYFFIGAVLMPLYYRLNLTSIYGYLEQRFGLYAYKTGAAFFLLSRTIGTAFRLYLVAIILQRFVMDSFGVPFAVTVSLTLLLIWIYTFRGGIKTIVYTDTLQTFFMLMALILTIVLISVQMDGGLLGSLGKVFSSPLSKTFFWEGGLSNPNHFLKQFLGGAFIAVAMTGIDQDMMQKNLSCRTLRDAQKNMFVFSLILIAVNLLFLILGALLYIYAGEVGIELSAKQTDLTYPTIALQYLSPVVGVLFVLGLVAAAYSTADSALTALTTSFCVDFLNIEKRELDEGAQKRIRMITHVGVSVTILFVILLFKALNNDAVINGVFRAAGYTYGPLLGLFVFGLTTRLPLRSPWVILVCLISPLLAYLFNNFSKEAIGFDWSFLLLAPNALFTYLGLLAVSLITSSFSSENS